MTTYEQIKETTANIFNMIYGGLNNIKNDEVTEKVFVIVNKVSTIVTKTQITKTSIIHILDNIINYLNTQEEILQKTGEGVFKLPTLG